NPSHSRARPCREEGSMNYVDLEQMERSLAASPSRPDCAQEAGSGVVAWGPFTMTHSGLSIAIVKAQGEGKEATERPISGAFEVLGHARDPNGRGWGRWLHWRDADGRLHNRHVTDAALQGDAASICAVLADEGLHIV